MDIVKNINCETIILYAHTNEQPQVLVRKPIASKYSLHDDIHVGIGGEARTFLTGCAADGYYDFLFRRWIKRS